MLGASIVCPGRPQVIPLMPEPILKQDGSNKNDCERNAFQRFLPKLRVDHPLLFPGFAAAKNCVNLVMGLALG